MKTFLIVLKKYILPLIVLLVIGGGGYYIYTEKNKKTDVTMVVRSGDFVQQVSVSGKVVPTEELDLSFEQPGFIRSISVKVGDSVKKGQVLASEDTAQLEAQLAGLRAGIEVQKARLNQALAGASAEEVSLAETAVMNAETALANAKDAYANTKLSLLDTLQDVMTKSDDAVLNKGDQMFSNAQTASPKFSVTTTDAQLKETIESERILLGQDLRTWKTSVASLTVNSDFSLPIREAKAALGDVKLFLDHIALVINNPNSCVSDGSGTCTAVSTTWKADISSARTSIGSAISTLTAAETSMKAAESSVKTATGNVKTAESQLVLKKAPARSQDVRVYEAQLRQAEVGTQEVLTQIRKRQIIAPMDGVVTNVPVKAGNAVSSVETVLSLMSSDPLQVESFVPEKNIPFVQIGNKANIELDAYGSNVLFPATVVSIDPAETLVDGVSTYKTVLTFVTEDARVKPGMTASILIDTETKSQVIAVPQGVIEEVEGIKVVKVKVGEGYVDRPVQTGSVSSLGQIEIVSGLNEGDVILLKAGS